MLEPRHLLSAVTPADESFMSHINTPGNDITDTSWWPYSQVVGRRVFYNGSGTASPIRYDGNWPSPLKMVHSV